MGTEQVQVWTLPYQRNAFFTGREETLARIHTFLQAQQQVFVSQPGAISGLGGIGKTQTAIEYAYRHAHEYQYVLWVQADTRDTVTTDYVSLAHLLALPEQDAQDQTITVEAVKRWLTHHSGWLLLFDNADDLSLLDAFLPPRPRGHILFTTRTHLIGGRAARVEMEEMTEEEGTRFLLARIGMLTPDAPLSTVSASLLTLATTLVNELDGLPLALDQAGAYIEETGCGLPRYLDLYQTQRHILLARRSKRPTSHPEPVATTWSLSFERIAQANPAAAEVLRCCAFLSPDAIPEELLTTGVSHFSPRLQQAVRDPLHFDEAISELLNYSLLRRQPDTGNVSVHRLVQAVLKDDLDPATQQRWAEAILQAVDQLFPFGEFATWEVCQRYLPHAMLCAESIEHWTISSETAAHLLYNVASYLDDRAQYPEAEPLYQRALAIREQVLGPEHPDAARPSTTWRSSIRTRGSTSRPSRSTSGPWRSASRRWGRSTPIPPPASTTWPCSMTTRGSTSRPSRSTSGRWRSTRRRWGRSTPIPPGASTTWPSSTMTRGSTRRPSRSTSGRWRSANRCWGRASRLPPTPSTTWRSSMMNQGKYEQAEPLYQRALAIYEQALGPEHPDTARSLNNLAILYDDQGKYEQAEPLYQRALAIREKALGPEHPDLTARPQQPGRPL